MIVPASNCWIVSVTENRHIEFMQQTGVNDHVKSIDAKLLAEEVEDDDLL